MRRDRGLAGPAEGPGGSKRQPAQHKVGAHGKVREGGSSAPRSARCVPRIFSLCFQGHDAPGDGGWQRPWTPHLSAAERSLSCGWRSTARLEGRASVQTWSLRVHQPVSAGRGGSWSRRWNVQDTTCHESG